MKYEFKLEVDVDERDATQEDVISGIDKILSTIINELGCIYPDGVNVSLLNHNDATEDSLFEKWWNLYGKKRGRKKTYAKWCRMSMKDKVSCLSAVGDYVKSTPDVRFRKDPLTYLNGECWNDDIIPCKQQNSGIETGVILHDTKNKNYKEDGW